MLVRVKVGVGQVPDKEQVIHQKQGARRPALAFPDLGGYRTAITDLRIGVGDRETTRAPAS